MFKKTCRGWHYGCSTQVKLNRGHVHSFCVYVFRDMGNQYHCVEIIKSRNFQVLSQRRKKPDLQKSAQQIIPTVGFLRDDALQISPSSQSQLKTLPPFVELLQHQQHQPSSQMQANLLQLRRANNQYLLQQCRRSLSVTVKPNPPSLLLQQMEVSTAAIADRRATNSIVVDSSRIPAPSASVSTLPQPKQLPSMAELLLLQQQHQPSSQMQASLLLRQHEAL